MPSAAAAGTWQLGDRTVNRLGLGAMRLTGSGVFGAGVPSSRDVAVEVLRRAVALGVNHIDTASYYFSQLRSANELINTALAPYPDDLVIATKIGPSRDPSGRWLPAATPEQLRGLVEENLRQLGRDVLDLVYLRVHGEISVGDAYLALAALQTEGLIRHLGISGVDLGRLAEAREVAPMAAVQNRYTVEFRDEADDAVFAFCAEQGIAFVPYFTIAGAGRHAGPAARENETVSAVAEAHGATPAQVRLAWTLQLAENVLVIPGTGNPDHLVENVAAAGLRLSADELAALDASRPAT